MEKVERDLARLIAFPTVSNRPVTELSAFLAHRLEDLGFRIERFPDPTDCGKHNLVASIGPEGSDGLVLTGHMDVVPTENQPWTSDPFVLTERGDRLHGRGTADMKGFFAATLHALEAIRRDEYARELVCIWTYDEEVGCLGSHHLACQYEALGRRLPSACLVGEPTDFQVLRMHPGHVAFTVELEGRAAHSSRPDLGSNAIVAASEAIRRLQRLADELRSEQSPMEGIDRPWVAFNIATIRGGSAVNIVPDRCVLEVGYRPLPGMRAEDVFERAQHALEDIGSVEMRLDRVTRALHTPRGTALEDLLLREARSPDIGAASFATDGGNLARLGAAPLVFGPGSITVAHQADEYVERSALHEAIPMLERVVRSACVE